MLKYMSRVYYTHSSLNALKVKRILLFSAVVGVTLLVGIFILSWRFYHQYVENLDLQVQGAEIQGRLLFSERVMQDCIMLYSVSGDPRWKETYLAFLKKMQNDVAVFGSLKGNHDKLGKVIINSDLIDTNTRILALVDSGDLLQAQSIALSEAVIQQSYTGAVLTGYFPGVQSPTAQLSWLWGSLAAIDRLRRTLALLSSYTGDLRWKDWYQDTESLIHSLLTRGREGVADSSIRQLLSEIETQHERLEYYEVTAFDLVRVGSRAAALENLQSRDYLNEESNQLRNLQLLHNEVERVKGENFRSEHRRGWILLLSLISGLLLLGFAWYLLHLWIKRAFENELKMRRDLYNSKKFLDSIVTFAPVMIYARRVSDMTIQFWNRCCETKFHTLAGAIIGTTGSELFSRCGMQTLRAFELQALEERCSIENMVAIGANGEDVVLRSIQVPLTDESGAVEFILTLAQDITEQAKHERALQRALESAMSSDRAKSEFVANISHEMRTPLNGIIGMAQLLELEELTERQREDVEMLLECSEHLRGLINQVLDFSKINSGKFEIKQVPMALSDVLRAVNATTIPLVRQKELAFNCDIPGDVPSHFISDPYALKQLLINLLGNAVKFTDSGEIELSLSKKSQFESEVILQFTIRDTGIGIEPELLEEIFEPFAQADASTTRKFGGTGLGLAICSNLAKAMGGRIWVESELGNGSKFHFTINAKLIDSCGNVEIIG